MLRKCHEIQAPTQIRSVPLLQTQEAAHGAGTKDTRRIHLSLQQGLRTPIRPAFHHLLTMNEERVTVPCCGYKAKLNGYPVMWNQFNKVVQCHNCGNVWVPKQFPSRPQYATRAALGTPAPIGQDGALQIEPPDKLTEASPVTTSGEVAT